MYAPSDSPRPHTNTLATQLKTSVTELQVQLDAGQNALREVGLSMEGLSGQGVPDVDALLFDGEGESDPLDEKRGELVSRQVHLPASFARLASPAELSRLSA